MVPNHQPDELWLTYKTYPHRRSPTQSTASGFPKKIFNLFKQISRSSLKERTPSSFFRVVQPCIIIYYVYKIILSATLFPKKTSPHLPRPSGPSVNNASATAHRDATVVQPLVILPHLRWHTKCTGSSASTESMTGWWLTYPSEKYWSVGIIILNIWKVTKFMFQTTNQIYIFIYIYLMTYDILMSPMKIIQVCFNMFQSPPTKPCFLGESRPNSAGPEAWTWFLGTCRYSLYKLRYLRGRNSEIRMRNLEVTATPTAKPQVF